jgi:hypothetical protein
MTSDTRHRLLADFDTIVNGKRVIARAVRERPATPGNVTVARRLRIFTLLAVLLAACGGGSHRDTYAKATDTQQSCCEHLGGPGRDQCLQKIVRVEDFARTSQQNQATYACVVDHFTCDAQTGHATQQSAQAQIDCIQDLQ